MNIYVLFLNNIYLGNLEWPTAFYQIKNSVPIRNNDYFIGTCVYGDPSASQLLYVEDLK